MKISIGADHRGFAIKQVLIETLQSVEWLDVGAHSDDASDYPVFAHRVVAAMQQKQAAAGVLLCGSGIGMSIAANRHPGIYAGLCWAPAVATVAKEHDNINLLVLPADFITAEQACAIVRAWLAAKPLGSRHQDRLTAIDGLQGGE
jgi:ribose 5-phosphate isomerase B